MGYRLLLADDSITIQKVVGIIFAGDEYDLTVTDNGITALERARTVIPDIMLVDALMPGKDGYEVCREVRRDPALATVPLLLLTGVFEPFDEVKAKDAGADDFISKPFESQTLIDKVRSLIDMGAWRKSAAPPVTTPSTPSPEPFQAPVEPAVVPPAPAAVAAFLPDSDVVVETFPEMAVSPAPESFPEVPSAPIPAPAIEPPAESVAAVEDFVEIVEVSAEDDPWGIGEMESEVVEEIPFGELLEVTPGESLEGVEELEPFAFEEDTASVLSYDFAAVPQRAGEVSAADAGPAVLAEPSLPSPVEEPEFGFEVEPEVTQVPVATEEFAFELEPAPVEALAPPAEPYVIDEPSAVAAEPLGVETAPIADAADMSFGEVIPMPVEIVPPPAEPGPEVPASAAVSTITEEQLMAALSTVSREVIERIVWEVVPDLAEALIKEEIRKIREAA